MSLFVVITTSYRSESQPKRLILSKRRLISFANPSDLTIERPQCQQNCQQTVLKKLARVVEEFA